MIFPKFVFGAVAALALSAAIPAATAAVVYNLDKTAVGAFTPSPFGSVSLDESIANHVTVTVDLFNGNMFVDTGSHHAFGFTLNTDNYNVTVKTAGFAWLDSAFKQSGFGLFGDGLDCFDCGNGASSPVPPPLVFTVQGAGLTASDFVVSTRGYLFTADIFGNSSTGPIASGSTPVLPPPAITPPLTVPEPATLALVGFALAGIAFTRRRMATMVASVKVASLDAHHSFG